MADVFSALLPTFILIALGYIVRASKIATADQFGMVNRFGYFVLYPSFLFTLVASGNFAGGDAGAFLLALLGGFFTLVTLALALRLFFRGDDPAYTSLFQGSVRWNGFALLAAAEGLYGAQGFELVGLAFGPLVLMINVICVIVLSIWGSAKATSMRALLDQIIVNPLILGCAAGLAANFAGLHDLGPATDALQLLGGAAMPVALMCVGAALDFSALRTSGVKVATACFMRLIVAPSLTYGACVLIGAPPLPTAVAVGIASTPTAAAAYTFAREMGGDARLMAAIITATTILSFVTMPIAITLALR
ncbi:MAG TPA: AEC family transporter [Candidatus Binatia bacterium]|nr:AEC family transporter [Candidatus Binatia bacterium]